MFKRNGQPIALRTGLVIDDVQIVLPLSAERMAELEIVEEPDPPRPDDRYYFIHGQPDGSFAAEPRPLPQVLDMLWVQIKARRDQLQEAGCQVGADWFHNDVKSRTQWERMANRSAAQAAAEPYLIAGLQVQWKTMAGTFVALTAGKIREVVAAFEIQESAIFLRAEQHRAALAALTDVDVMAAYDISAGWPGVYEVQP